MKTRIITGAIYASIVIICLFISSASFPLPALILFIFMAAMAAWEMEKIMGEKLPKLQRAAYYLSALAFIPAVFFVNSITNTNYGQKLILDSSNRFMLRHILNFFSLKTTAYAFALCSLIFFLAMGFIFLNRAIKSGPEKAKSLLKLGAAAFYIFLPFLCAVSMLCFFSSGKKWLILAIFTPWISDTAAYFAGSSYGKKKIFDKLSPNKTLIGFLGAIIATAILYFIFAAIWVLPNLEDTGFLKSLGILILFMIFGVLGSLVSQVGDLLASVIKRNAGIKDFGKIFPGHGGMMDRIDSMLLSIPFIFIILILNSRFL